MTTFHLYDRWDNQIGTVMGVVEAVRDWTLNGEHLLTVRTPMPLSKGQRIVYMDSTGRYREFIVSEVEESDETGVPVTIATCEDSIAELLGDVLVEKEPEGTALACLTSALSSSRWVAGTVDVPGTARMSFYHVSARQAVNDVVERFGAELSTTIEVSGSRITARKVNVTARVGADNGRRFTCREGLRNVKRTVLADDVCTRLYGYGKSLECTDADGNATGGFSRKLDFASVNGGKEYVESESALQTWGRPDGNGGKAHVDGIAEFPDCEDEAELMELTERELERRSAPMVSYTASVSTFSRAGLDARGVGDGDGVAIVDENFDPPLRLAGRVLAISEDLLDASGTSLTLGNMTGTVADTITEQRQGIADLRSHAASWDGAAQVSSSYINAIVSRLNEEFDAGGSYKYESFAIGTIYSSVPLDGDFKPVRTPASAIQLSGEGMRIADGVTSTGEFDWRTFGTGGGFTADVITAGTITGGNSYWNLETGDMHLENGTIDITGTIGGKVVYTSLSPAQGLRIIADGELVGGIEVVGGDAYLRASRCGSTQTHYITTGHTDAGNTGTSFVNPYGNYCDIEALKAVDDKSGRTTGVGMACFDKPFVQASTYYEQAWLYPPTYPQTYLEQPPEQLYLKRGGSVFLRRSSAQGIFMGDGYTLLRLDAKHYVEVRFDGVIMRCGDKGIGCDAGGFKEITSWT